MVLICFQGLSLEPLYRLDPPAQIQRYQRAHIKHMGLRMLGRRLFGSTKERCRYSIVRHGRHLETHPTSERDWTLG